MISRKPLRDFAKRHADAKDPLDAWWRIAKKTTWKNLVDVRATWPSADLVNGFTVFNIKGKRYRLIARISFKRETVFVKYVLTHDDYVKGDWKE